jgi:hypothetical protein
VANCDAAVRPKAIAPRPIAASLRTSRAGLSKRAPMRDHRTDRGEGGELADPRCGIDSSTTSGQLILNVLGSMAQFERKCLERRREGIAKAR